MSDHKRKGISAALIAAGVVATLPASATLVTLTETVTLGQLLTGNSTTVNFNIGSLLSSQGYGASDVLSGDLVVYGLSDPSYGAANAQPYDAYNVTGYTSHTASYSYYVSGYYSCNWSGWSCYYSPGYSYTSYNTVTDTESTRSRDILNTDNVADVMQVTAGSSTASDTADQTLHTVDPYGPKTYDGSTGSYYNGYNYLYSQERDVYDAIYGPLQVSMGLDLFALQDIWADGILDFGVDASVGQFMLQSAELSFQVDDGKQGLAVPEPGSLSLFGAALAAGALVRRRRRKESKE